jgi:hypothetical protein
VLHVRSEFGRRIRAAWRAAVRLGDFLGAVERFPEGSEFPAMDHERSGLWSRAVPMCPMFARARVPGQFPQVGFPS